MTIRAIADLHLAHARPELERDRFAARWADHVSRIEREWRAVVGPEDIVLIPGDISMARTHRQAQPDLAWLGRLPGKKILAPGNHDLWWNELTQVRAMMRPSLSAVDRSHVSLGGAVYCGFRGIPVPREDDREGRAKAQDYLREVSATLERAAGERVQGGPLYVLWHFAPFAADGTPGPWVELFEEHGVTACVYGHLHQAGQWSGAARGRGGVRYLCVAADAIGFRPIRISDS